MDWCAIGGQCSASVAGPNWRRASVGAARTEAAGFWHHQPETERRADAGALVCSVRVADAEGALVVVVAGQGSLWCCCCWAAGVVVDGGVGAAIVADVGGWGDGRGWIAVAVGWAALVEVVLILCCCVGQRSR